MRDLRLVMGMGMGLGLVMAAGACTPNYGNTNIFVVGGDTQASSGADPLVLDEGGVLIIEAYPRASGEADYDGTESFELRSADSRVASIERTILADTWIITADVAGTARVYVEINGDIEDDFEIEVRPSTEEE